MADSPTPKPGFRTTEFWLSLLAMLVGAIYASGALTDGSAAFKAVGLAASILSAMGYTISRGMVKAAAAPTLPAPPA